MAVAHTPAESCPHPRSRGKHDLLAAVCYPVPTHLAQEQQPWKGIYEHNTLNSVRHHAYYIDPTSPKDDLDFVIKSSYDHQKDLFKNKQEVICQAHVYDEKYGHVLKNRIKSLPDKKMHLNHPLITTTQEQKENTYSTKMLLGGAHVHATSNGYSRKPHTGGFFIS